jgi:PDZ domain-containing protein
MILDQSEQVAPSPEENNARPKILRTVVLSLIAGGLAVASFTVPLPMFTVDPGPAPSTADLIEIDARTFESKGEFHITTVTLSEATFADSVRGWVSPDVGVLPRSAVYPPDQTEQEVDTEIAAQMDESQYAAAVSALQELGYGLEMNGALVRATIKGTPSEKKIKPGDVIVAVAGTPIAAVEDLQTQLSRHSVGSDLTLAILRDEKPHEEKVRLVQRPEVSENPVVGVEVLQNFRLPFPIKIDAGSIGGPSAGLMFALAIVDLLDVDDLTAGRIIAGTGEILPDGTVRPIGGVTQKVEGAERVKARVFIVPAGEAEEAKRAVDGNMKVIGVATLHDAVAALREG